MEPRAEISQRDLRMRSKEIMDSVERGQTFTVTRDGRQIAALVPLRRGRRFITREEYAETFALAPPVDLARFRADQEQAFDQDLTDPYAR